LSSRQYWPRARFGPSEKDTLTQCDAEVVQHVVARVFRDNDVDVGQCLAVPAKLDQCLRPTVACSAQIRLGGKNTAEIILGQVGLCEGQGG
jgi:hypothetical protein